MGAYPRRKVVKSKHAYAPGSGGTVYYDCTLSCGHVVLAYGRAPNGNPFGQKTPPKSCECRKCAGGAA